MLADERLEAGDSSVQHPPASGYLERARGTLVGTTVLRALAQPVYRKRMGSLELRASQLGRANCSPQGRTGLRSWMKGRSVCVVEKGMGRT